MEPYSPATGTQLELIMIRIFPATWTALHVGLISIATWLLVETDALNGMAPMFFH
jgi:hypothetical protein